MTPLKRVKASWKLLDVPMSIEEFSMKLFEANKDFLLSPEVKRFYDEQDARFVAKMEIGVAMANTASISKINFDPDRVRGIPADVVCYDEVQDFLPEED